MAGFYSQVYIQRCYVKLGNRNLKLKMQNSKPKILIEPNRLLDRDFSQQLEIAEHFSSA